LFSGFTRVLPAAFMNDIIMLNPAAGNPGMPDGMSLLPDKAFLPLKNKKNGAILK